MKKLIQGCGLALLGLFIGAFVDLPVLAQVVVNPGGGSSGSSAITIGTTTITGGATTQVLYNLAGVVQSSSNLTYSGGTTTVDNGAAAVSPFVVKDNNVAVLTVADGGAVTTTGVWNWTTNSSYFSTGAGLFFGASPNDGVAGIVHKTSQTPDTVSLVTPGTSNSWHLTEFADFNAFDFNNGACGTSACTDPGLIIHSAVQDTTQYNHNAVWGTAGGAIKALTAGAATSVVRIPVASGAGTGGVLNYTIFASDATDHQTREGEIKFAVVNKAGTETCTISAASEAADGSVVAVSAGTLTYAITCDTTPANAVDLQFNAVSSLAETTLNAYYRVTLVGAGQPARQ